MPTSTYPRPLPNQPYVERRSPFEMLIFNAFAWSFIGFLWCFPNDIRYHYSSPLIVTLLASGICCGSFGMYFLTSRQLLVLEKKEEISYSRMQTIVLPIIAIAAVIAGAILLFPYISQIPQVYMSLSFNFLYPIIPALSATRAVMYFRWGKRNKRRLYFQKRKLVAVPY